MINDSERWPVVCDYVDEVFGHEDEHLRTLMSRAVEAGLPDIAVSAGVGRLLSLVVRLTGVRTIVEVGTLAGYSGIWLARALPEGGRLISIEVNPTHAAFARKMFEEAGVADRAEVREGDALEVLPALVGELGDQSVGMVFLDGVKADYPVYFEHARKLLEVGGVLAADNVLGGGDWWIGSASGSNASRDAVDAFNRAVSASDEFEAAALPIREGVLLARKVN